MEQRETLTHTQTNRKYNKWICINQIERERGGKWSKIQKHRNRYKDRGDKTNIVSLLH